MIYQFRQIVSWVVVLDKAGGVAQAKPWVPASRGLSTNDAVLYTNSTLALGVAIYNVADALIAVSNADLWDIAGGGLVLSVNTTAGDPGIS